MISKSYFGYLIIQNVFKKTENLYIYKYNQNYNKLIVMRALKIKWER